MTLPAHFTPIDSREQLLGMLVEAAEIEHNLMCCYLYAAFSMKQDVDEGLSTKELGAVRRWRRTIMDVAIEEMGHLTMVANIMSSIGGTPHFGRQNFPIAAGYHPSGIVVRLAPFNADTLDHFIFLERPDGIDIPDGVGFEPPVQYERGHVPGRIMPSAQDYETVGQLYAAIAQGLTSLAGRDGESALFVGDPARQIGPDVLKLNGLARVACLKTALEAIKAIVLEGEGSPGGSEDSHYQRFLGVRTEYRVMVATRSDFVAARPAAHNPLMRRPPIAEGRTWVSASPAAELLDIVNAAYNQMLRLLLQAYAETRGPDHQRAIVEAAVDLMYLISPIASELTRLPAQADNETCTAGMSFATLRATATLPVGAATDDILLERLREIAAATTRATADSPRLAATASKMAILIETLTSALGFAVDHPAAPTPLGQAASPVAPTLPSVPVPTVRDGVEQIEASHLTLHFDAKRCIHSRHCVLGQPQVFKANVEGPWIDPDAASTEAMVTVAHMCPSGAIQYTRKDGGDEEAKPPVNLVQLRENGPLGFRGDLKIDGHAIGMRATLCRCGASMNKPFCDGSHNAITFVGSGEPATRPSEPLTVRDGVVDIRPEPNGPLSVRGNVEICAGTGRTIDRVSRARLCRCGQSASKPFCDNSHERVGFVAP
jgi:CDGSH-type Zn-finger protein/uncharacterized Fe-S cluster protein YjdI